MLDVNEANNNFYCVIYEAMNSFVPLELFKKSHFPIWFSPELKHLVREKTELHRKFKQSGNYDDYRVFSGVRHKCKQLRDACYKHYIRNTENNIYLNPKSFWRFINDKRNNYDLPSSMHFNNQYENSLDGIVGLFANHLSSVFTSHDNVMIPDYNFDVSINFGYTGHVTEGGKSTLIENSNNSSKIESLPNQYIKLKKKRNSKSFMETFLDIFACLICLGDILGSSTNLVQCMNGHTICEDCSLRCQNCPVCRVPYDAGIIRNLLMEGKK
ncbi:hypothetical protein JTB14_025943 [Gonioctena quinquepunctata]|nr:hypothetical protein JTB14_025943 [Gonioctena quinquepunctata]